MKKVIEQVKPASEMPKFAVKEEKISKKLQTGKSNVL